MDCKLTPEICAIINETVNSLFYKIGLGGFVVLIFLAAFLYWIFKQLVEHNFEKYKAELEKNGIKNIELWKQQKELMFDFVKFLEKRLFNNPALQGSDVEVEKEKNAIFAELNEYYGQLYLVMETGILNTLNKYLNSTVGPVQRFYIYKELRKQLMSIIHEKFNDQNCPFIEGDPTAVKYLSKTGEEKITTNIEEVKAAYPFIEETGIKKYKTLPWFAENKK